MCPLLDIGKDFEGRPITVWIPGPGDKKSEHSRHKLEPDEAKNLVDSFDDPPVAVPKPLKPAATGGKEG